MVPLKTAIRELNAGHVGLMSRYGDFCTTEGELVTYLKRLERFEALGMEPEDLKKLIVGPVPDKFEKEAFSALPWETQVRMALAAARKMVAAVSPIYDLDSIHVEKQSEHPDDWYLWTVLARSTRGKYAVWSMNLSTGGLFYGHYDITDWRRAYSVMDDKRGHQDDDDVTDTEED